ncbi:hypothetical protein ACFW81_23960 [Streptomyces angustmyceticus]|uniref:hypothetical protein n=1 Tax=Streptomyces angustmyceticus TaxID=285578 RepID=UPI0036C11FD5
MTTSSIPIPPDLCPVHRALAKEWRDNHFDIWDPGDWPAGRSVTSGKRFHLMDNRTPVDEREAEFKRKNREQVEMITRICRSGRSPQCTPGHRDEAATTATARPAAETAVGDGEPLVSATPSARPITEVPLGIKSS